MGFPLKNRFSFARYLIYERRPTTAMPSMEKHPTIVEEERKREKRPRLNRD
jgi:hypothetical protein